MNPALEASMRVAARTGWSPGTQLAWATRFIALESLADEFEECLEFLEEMEEIDETIAKCVPGGS